MGAGLSLLGAPVEAEGGAPRGEGGVDEAAGLLALGEGGAVGLVVVGGVLRGLALEVQLLRSVCVCGRV